MKILCVRVFVTVITACFAASTLAADRARPNVIVILGDDMGFADVGVHGCRDIPTPNLDQFAAAGVRCTNGYVSGPYCSPTRAGLMTGRYQTRFGHEFNPSGKKRRGQVGEQAPPAGLPLTETTIADHFKKAGYTTGIVGKWHLGNANKFHPMKRGFDEFFGFLGGAHSYFPGPGKSILRGHDRIQEPAYLTDAFGREAAAFIDRHADEPFFLYLAFNAVHTPMHANDERLEKFKQIQDTKRRTYAAMMSALDDAVGTVVAKLRDENLENDTLVFFCNDNGGPTMPGTTINASSNEPLRGSKRTTLEGGIHVPFLVKWPGHVPAGEVYENLVIQLDVLPTALAAAGIKLPDDTNVEGINLLPYFNNEVAGKPHDALYWRFGDQMAIRQGDWKLVQYDGAVDGQKGFVKGPFLYNLADDIGETNDLIKAEPERATALQAAWDRWNEANVPPRWGARHLRKQNNQQRAPKQTANTGNVETTRAGS